jgi:hypothetical protein
MAYSFKGSTENIYGRYLYATYIRMYRRGLVVFAPFTAACAAFTAYVLLHPQDFNPGVVDALDYASGRSLWNRALYTVIYPFSIIACPLLILFSLMMAAPFFLRDLSRLGYAWPRAYCWYIRRVERGICPPNHAFFFGSFERRPMAAKVGERSIQVAGRDGPKKVFSYRYVKKAFRHEDMVVLQRGRDVPQHRYTSFPKINTLGKAQGEPKVRSVFVPSGEVVLDLNEVPAGEREAFLMFLDSRLPDACACHYKRKAPCALGAGKGDAPDGGGEA